MYQNQAPLPSASLVLFAIACAVCVAGPAMAVPPATTVIVVRHAEKADDTRDPALSDAGAERAGALAAALGQAGLDAIYASQYRRTRLTATPAARKAGLPVRVEPIEGDIPAWADNFSDVLLARHPGNTVLVVGHSNTVPALVAALCRCEVEPLTEHDYDRLFIVSGAGRSEAGLVSARYGGPGRTSD